MSKIKDLPKIGFGTWLITDQEEINTAVNAAIDNDYTLIDTAFVYENESLIGNTLKGKNLDNLWITTKFMPFKVLEDGTRYFYDNMDEYKNYVETTLEKQIQDLGVKCVDLVLLHTKINHETNIVGYKVLQDFRKRGLIKYIGVSNFDVESLINIKENCGEFPYNNQIVLSPATRRVEIETFCKENNITLTGYSILKPYYNPNPQYSDYTLTLEDKNTIDEIAKKHSQTPASVMNKWALQHGYAIIPKSVNVDRIANNKEYNFNLDDSDMLAIDGMNKMK